AYGDGTAQSEVGVERRTTGATGESSPLALPAGRVGDAGADHSAECVGKNQSADRPPAQAQQRHRGKWRRRFLEQDVAGLHDELRPGRPRPISDERVAQLVRKTLETKPKDGTHWSVRQMAKQTRLSKSTVHRIWQGFGLEPHRQRHLKL